MSRVSDPDERNPEGKPPETEGDSKAAAELSSSLETAEVLARLYGWSADRARGYSDGIAYRVNGIQPSRYLLVGIDDYAVGFRAGYYKR